MKEATGEFSMTVVTIIAICVIAGVIAVLKDPIKEYIQSTWTSTSNEMINSAKGQ